jgi:CO dehydrogenase nickel-insertion accessory protein CooC1
VTQHDWEVFIAVLLAKTRDGQKEREREREKKRLNLMKFGLIWKILEGCMVPVDLWKHQLFNHGLIRQVAVP